MTDPQPGGAVPSPDVPAHFYYPNRMGRVLFLAFEDVLGYNALHALLKLAGFPRYTQMPPPGTSDRQFKFEVVGGLTQALLDMYGPRGGRGIALRVGRMTFKHGIREYGPMMGAAELTFQLLPLSLKLEKGARGLADLFNVHTDQVVRLQETPDTILWHIERCPLCWGIHDSTEPCCHLAVGLLQEGMLWLSGGKTFSVEERSCVACGDERCTIEICKKPLD